MKLQTTRRTQLVLELDFYDASVVDGNDEDIEGIVTVIFDDDSTGLVEFYNDIESLHRELRTELRKGDLLPKRPRRSKAEIEAAQEEAGDGEDVEAESDDDE